MEIRLWLTVLICLQKVLFNTRRSCASMVFRLSVKGKDNILLRSLTVDGYQLGRNLQLEYWLTIAVLEATTEITTQGWLPNPSTIRKFRESTLGLNVRQQSTLLDQPCPSRKLVDLDRKRNTAEITHIVMQIKKTTLKLSMKIHMYNRSSEEINEIILKGHRLTLMSK